MTTYLQEEIDLDDKPINTNVKVCYNKTSHPDMLTEKELESVTTVFRSFESGLREATIYPSDLHKAMCMLGLNPTEQEVVDIPNEIARKGLIYFPDFCELVLTKFRQSESEEEDFFQSMFKMMCGTEPYPADFRAKKYKLNKHFLTKDDFKHIMKNLPVPVADEDIEEMFEFADKNRNGRLSYKEFEVMVKPQTPPEVTKPHITDIGMNPQLFSPPTTQEAPSNFASPILPASRGTFSSRSSLASYSTQSKKQGSGILKIGSASTSGSNTQIAHL